MRGMGRQPPASGGERAFGAFQAFWRSQNLPQAGLIPAEDDGNTGVPMEARFHGAEPEGLE